MCKVYSDVGGIKFVHLYVRKLVGCRHVQADNPWYDCYISAELIGVIEGIKLESYARDKGLSGPPSRSLQWSRHRIQQYTDQTAIFLLELSRLYGYTSILLQILTNIVISQPILMRFSIRFVV